MICKTMYTGKEGEGAIGTNLDLESYHKKCVKYMLHYIQKSAKK